MKFSKRDFMKILKKNRYPEERIVQDELSELNTISKNIEKYMNHLNPNDNNLDNLNLNDNLIQDDIKSEIINSKPVRAIYISKRK